METYPRDELFQIPVAELRTILLAVLHLKERRRLRLFLRHDEFGRFVSALVYLPRDRYNTENRLRIQAILAEELHGTSLDYTSQVSESVLARLHFVLRVDPSRYGAVVEPIDTARIETRLVDATRAWREDFAEATEHACGIDRTPALVRAYAEAFPAGYREEYSAADAVVDMQRLEALPPGDGLDGRPAGPARRGRGTPPIPDLPDGSAGLAHRGAAGAAAHGRGGHGRATVRDRTLGRPRTRLDLRLRAPHRGLARGHRGRAGPCSRRPSPRSGWVWRSRTGSTASSCSAG